MEDATSPTPIELSSPIDDMDTPFADMAAGTALFVVALGVLVLIFVALRERRRRQLIAMFLERGQQVPPEMLPRSASRYGEMRRGAWLAALGLGIGLTSWMLTREMRWAAWGIVPLCLGAASFINAALFYPRNDSRQ